MTQVQRRDCVQKTKPMQHSVFGFEPYKYCNSHTFRVTKSAHWPPMLLAF